MNKLKLTILFAAIFGFAANSLSMIDDWSGFITKEPASLRTDDIEPNNLTNLDDSVLIEDGSGDKENEIKWKKKQRKKRIKADRAKDRTVKENGGTTLGDGWYSVGKPLPAQQTKKGKANVGSNAKKNIGNGHANGEKKL